MRTYQVCKSNEGWVPVLVASETQNMDYTVMVCPWGIVKECICECPGYTFRSHCKHQQIAFEKVCRWSSVGGCSEAQTEQQEEMKVCPRCGGHTKWELDFE